MHGNATTSTVWCLGDGSLNALARASLQIAVAIIGNVHGPWGAATPLFTPVCLMESLHSVPGLLMAPVYYPR